MGWVELRGWVDVVVRKKEAQAPARQARLLANVPSAALKSGNARRASEKRSGGWR
jgi:hypothetical protein